jgi:hypothetical protein
VDIGPGDLVSVRRENCCPSAGNHLSAHREDDVSAVTNLDYLRLAPGTGSPASGCETATPKPSGAVEPRALRTVRENLRARKSPGPRRAGARMILCHNQHEAAASVTSRAPWTCGRVFHRAEPGSARTCCCAGWRCCSSASPNAAPA